MRAYAKDKTKPYAGAVLPSKHGYNLIAGAIRTGKIAAASTTPPSTDKLPWVEFRTDIIHRQGEMLCCGQVCRPLCVLAWHARVHVTCIYMPQALLVNGTGMSLDELGVEQLPVETYLSFKNLNSQLAPAGKPALFAFRTTALDIESLIGLKEGIFGVVSYHGHHEDVRDVHSNFVRDCYHQQQIELIPHFITFNLYTNVVITYPEVWEG